jgi:hypothetical protein
MALYHAAIVLYCPAMVLYHAAIVLYCSAMALYHAAIVLYCSAMALYHAAIVLYCPAMILYRSTTSGRVEKGVDQVIGHRQKRKGSSWRPKGSKALAILKILELNGRWQQTWFPAQAA